MQGEGKQYWDDLSSDISGVDSFGLRASRYCTLLASRCFHCSLSVFSSPLLCFLCHLLCTVRLPRTVFSCIIIEFILSHYDTKFVFYSFVCFESSEYVS